jgi:phosphohistidine phosphatase SixA
MVRLLLAFGFMVASLAAATASDDAVTVIGELRRGGHAIVFRHVATDDSQKDVTPFRFDDMKAQRQLSDKGREAAKAIGDAMKSLGIPLGEVYASQLNRAIETGRLIAGKEATPKAELTDSSGGSASGMANPDGSNAKAGQAMRALLAASAQSNNLYITHKTNITDAFGKLYSDVGEGEALIVSVGSSGLVVRARIKASDWAHAPRS